MSTYFLMTCKNTITSYGFVAKFLHWGIGLLIFGMLIIGVIMKELPPTGLKWQLYGAHKAVGVVVILLVLTRLLWRALNIVPKLAQMPRWQFLAYKANLHLLYSLMILMPLTGIGMSLFGGHGIDIFGWFSLHAVNLSDPTLAKILASFCRSAHAMLAMLLFLSISVHVLAALYHHFVLKDDTLRKML